jgi:hypothetical protein
MPAAIAGGGGDLMLDQNSLEVLAELRILECALEKLRLSRLCTDACAERLLTVAGWFLNEACVRLEALHEAPFEVDLTAGGKP